MQSVDLVTLALKMSDHLYVLWTFTLLMIRFTTLFTILPGIGMGERGITIRIPAAMVMAFAAMSSTPWTTIPTDWTILIGSIASEILYGSILGLIPLLIVAGVQTGGQLASTTMGLGASALIDPTSGASVTELSKLYGDLAIILFLFLGGHYVVLQAASGMGTDMVPGTFIVGEDSLEILMQQSANIFKTGILISAPVIVALLLTQFVMGLISKAIPTVNIFVVSFPLTIGIGLLFSILALPEVFSFLGREYGNMTDVIGRLSNIK